MVEEFMSLGFQNGESTELVGLQHKQISQV
jgi:hypothetical protein